MNVPLPPAQDEVSAGALPHVRLRTELGDIVMVVDEQRAPKTAAAFLDQVDRGAFAGGRFWRTVQKSTDRGSPPIVVIQAAAADRSGRTAPVEPTTRTGLRHVEGTVSLPRGDGLPSSADGFFICIGEQAGLDAGSERIADGQGFAAFGQVIEGMDVVRAILGRPTRPDAPDAYLEEQVLAEPVVIYEASRLARGHTTTSIEQQGVQG